MHDILEELQDKWRDVNDSTDDWTELNLIGEFLDDLRVLREHLNV